MERVKIIRLGWLAPKVFQAIRGGQLEAGKIWNQCRDLHLEARKEHTKWPTKDDLQKATKGQYALHSQTIQMVCHGFLANIESTRQLRKKHPEMKMKYPWRSKKYRPLSWPAQTVGYDNGRVTCLWAGDVKRQRAKVYGSLQKLLARCKVGSKRHRKS